MEDPKNTGQAPELEEAAALARSAARILEEDGDDPLDVLGCATWRLADALAILAGYARAAGVQGPLPGVDQPTGRGAQMVRGGVRP